MDNDIPQYFCWTRFGTEAGQSFADILSRKEHERRRNGGVFLWGIGNAIGPSLKEFLRQGLEPKVLFSPIKSTPREKDIAPKTVVTWGIGETLEGTTFYLPHTSMVLSSYDPDSPKRAHYALVCRSAERLAINHSGNISLAALRNFLSGRPIGASQVTAVVRRDEVRCDTGGYEVAFRAELTAPYFLRLTEPRDVTSESLLLS